MIAEAEAEAQAQEPMVHFSIASTPTVLAAFVGALSEVAEMGLARREQAAAEKRPPKTDPPRGVKTVIADWIYLRVGDKNMPRLLAIRAMELLLTGGLRWDELERLLDWTAAKPPGESSPGNYFARKLQEQVNLTPPKRKPPRSVASAVEDWIYDRVADQGMPRMQTMRASELLLTGVLPWEELNRLLSRVDTYRRVPEGCRAKGTVGEFFSAQLDELKIQTITTTTETKGDADDGEAQAEQTAGDQVGK